MSNEGNNSGLLQDQILILDPSNAWALNMINAQYHQEAQKINQELQTLMDLLSKSTTDAAQSLYAVASAIYLGSICEAATQFGGATAALYAGREPNTYEKEQGPKLKNLRTQEDEINKALKDPNKEFTQAEKDKLFNEKKPNTNAPGYNENKSKLDVHDKDRLMRQKDEIKANIDRINNKLSGLYTRANMKMQALQSLANGIGAIPQKTQDSLQQQGQAKKAIYDAIERQAQSAYESAKAVLKGFIDIDYFAGLITLGSIQLR